MEVAWGFSETVLPAGSSVTYLPCLCRPHGSKSARVSDEANKLQALIESCILEVTALALRFAADAAAGLAHRALSDSECELVACRMQHRVGDRCRVSPYGVAMRHVCAGTVCFG